MAKTRTQEPGLAAETVIDRSESQVPADAPLARREEAQLPVHREAPTILDIMDRAITEKVSPEALEKLFSLYERDADRKAAQEFARAMAEFQAECPPIPKKSTAKITTRAGASYQYPYAELDTIANAVRPFLQKHGISYTWDSREEAGTITCACIVRHVNGHSVTAKFSCATDTAAAMSGAQKSASALTFARRQSLIQALGLTTCDPDDAAPAKSTEKISETQAANIQCALDELAAAPEDKKKFLVFMGVSKVSDILAADYRKATTALEDRRKALKEGQR